MGTRRYVRVLLSTLLVLAAVLAGGLTGAVDPAAADPIYAIVVQVSPVGSGTVDTLPMETDYELTASPANGWHFVDWTGDVTVADSPVTVTKDTATIVTANFALNQYTLTYDAGPGGTLSGDASQTVSHGGSGTAVTAVPNAGAGYRFVGWSDGVLTATRTDADVTADLDVTATFALDQYTLTYDAGPGGTLSGDASQTVSHGGSGTAVTAVPNAGAGYRFVGWSDGVLTATRTDADVTADLDVTATFALDQYTLTYDAGPGGTLSGDASQTVSHGGSGTAVTAVPNAGAGYRFVGWSDGVLTATRTDADVTADLDVTANFALDTFTITPSAGANGSITPSADQTVDFGADLTFTITPDTGYHVADVLVDGEFGRAGDELPVHERHREPHHQRHLRHQHLHDHAVGRRQRRHQSLDPADGRVRTGQDLHRQACERLLHRRRSHRRRLDRPRD